MTIRALLIIALSLIANVALIVSGYEKITNNTAKNNPRWEYGVGASATADVCARHQPECLTITSKKVTL